MGRLLGLPTAPQDRVIATQFGMHPYRWDQTFASQLFRCTFLTMLRAAGKCGDAAKICIGRSTAVQEICTTIC